MAHTQLLVHRFQCCFADRLNQKFIFLCGAGNSISLAYSLVAFFDLFHFRILPTDTKVKIKQV